MQCTACRYLTKHAAGTFQGVCADIDSPPPPLVQLSKIPATPRVLHVSNHLHHLLQPRWWEMFTDFPTIFFLNLITTNWSKETNLNLCKWYCIVLWQNTRSWNVGNVGLLHQLSKILQHACKLWHSFHCFNVLNQAWTEHAAGPSVQLIYVCFANFPPF